jgi:hypothetical protein
MQTRHIFDEFPESGVELTDERRHQKRLRLEPLVYDILKARYLKPLEEFWNTYEIPMNSDKCVVIVERRIHENLYFIMRNMAYFARGWSICIVCSDINMDYCKEISGHNKDRITLLPLFKGSPDGKTAKSHYNDLLKNPEFYSMLNTENLLFAQTDTYLRKSIPDNLIKYDYVASPYAWDETMAGGGLSFRKRTAMIDICRKMGTIQCDEDVYISRGVKELGYKMPKIMEGITYFAESCILVEPYTLYGGAVGVHQWWTYFTNDMDQAEWVFDAMLTLDI